MHRITGERGGSAARLLTPPMKSHKRANVLHATVCAILASAAGRPPDARAQAADDDARARRATGAGLTQAPPLQEVIVTANRRTESVLKIPYNITATTEQQLQSAGVTDFSKLSQVVPGLVYDGGGIREGGSNNGFILRGLNTDRTSTGDLPNLTVAPVSVYLDDTPIFANLHIADIARIEVLRGPQGTLYGNGSLGGTIRFIYNEPDPSAFAARVESETSQTEHAGGLNDSISGMVNVPLADVLALRVSGGRTFEHGFIDAKNLFVLGPDGAPILRTPGAPLTSLPVTMSAKSIDDSEQTFVHAALKYAAGPIKAVFSVHHQEEWADGESGDTRGVGAVPTAFSSAVTRGFLNDGFDAAIPPVYGADQSGLFLREPYHRHINLESLEVSADFGFATLTSSSSYFDNASDSVDDLSGSYQTNLAAFYLGFPRLAVPALRNTSENTFAEEVRLVSVPHGPISWVLGLFYQNQRQHFDEVDEVLGWNTFASTLFGVPITEERAFIYDRQMKFQDMALFGELTYKLTNRWQVTGGLRGFDQHLDISTVTELPICGAPCSNSGSDPFGTTLGGNSNTHRRVLGKFDTSYSVTDNAMAYLTVSQGFRRGGANGVPTAGQFAQNSGFVSFSPDTVVNYELGLKGRRGEFRYTADVFQVDWNKPQLNILTPVGAFYAAVNGDRARSRGVELSLDGQVSRNLNISASYTYTQAQLTSAFVVGGFTFGASGDPLPGVPKNQVALGADYARPLASEYSLIAHADAAYRSGVATQLPGSLGGPTNVAGFWMANANVGVEHAAWRVVLFVDNIFNERGVTTTLPEGALGPRHDVQWLSRPLTAGLRVAYKIPN